VEELLLGYDGGMERERLHFGITVFILLKKTDHLISPWILIILFLFVIQNLKTEIPRRLLMESKVPNRQAAI